MSVGKPAEIRCTMHTCGNVTRITLMFGVTRYAPWTAGTSPVAWILQTAMYPAVAALYVMMHVLCVVGFIMMAATSR